MNYFKDDINDDNYKKEMKANPPKIVIPKAIAGNELRVVFKESTTIHFYDGMVSSLCQVWHCGSPMNHEQSVTFAKNLPKDCIVEDMCKNCLDGKQIQRMAGVVAIITTCGMGGML